MSESRLRDLLHLYAVPRWTTVTTSRAQSVAEHSFRTTVIVDHIWCRLNIGRGLNPWVSLGEVLHWALAHDGPEAATGDLPATVKTRLPDGVWETLERAMCPWYDKTVDPRMRAVVRVADKIESVLWIEEYGTGESGQDGLTNDMRQLVQRTNEASQTFGWAGLRDMVVELVGFNPWLLLEPQTVPQALPQQLDQLNQLSDSDLSPDSST